ncbi:MAG: ferritin-like domain-containing protein [Solirubrobacterales bacterium]|nr:ferritin-like domain-containing protein [Solirubrobacterales bacterium]
MTDPINLAYQGIDREFAAESASTRRRFVQGAAATLGGMGMLGLAATPAIAANDAQTILDIAATAEVLATIVNTVGAERLGSGARGRGRTDARGVADLLDNLGRLLGGDRDRRGDDEGLLGNRARLDEVTTRNIRAAARHELIHYDVLTGTLGAKPLAKRIWVPDAVFASPRGLLETLEVGDQIFINAYLIGTTVFGNAGNGTAARYTGEFMGVEAVHRALARQSLGKLGNDHAFMVYDFTEIETAVSLLQGAGFGFGAQGSSPGRFYEFDEVKLRTPNPSAVDARSVS